MSTVHERRGAHDCPICDKSFSKNNVLKRHIITVHEGTQPRAVCDKSCSEASWLATNALEIKQEDMELADGEVKQTVMKLIM